MYSAKNWSEKVIIIFLASKLFSIIWPIISKSNLFCKLLIIKKFIKKFSSSIVNLWSDIFWTCLWSNKLELIISIKLSFLWKVISKTNGSPQILSSPLQSLDI